MLPRLFFVFVFLIIVTLGVVFFNGSNSQKNYTENAMISGKVTNSTPSPFPFEDITIPYLRARNYNSRLEELKLYSENSNYTSYLTRYISDGLKINGLLTIPKGEVPPGGWPAIVFVHGYIAPSVYKTTRNYISYVDFLSRNGFVVFKIDLRGHDLSDGDPGGAYYSSDYIIDTLNAYSALQSADFINPEKIGLWGHSMAGNVVFRSFVSKGEIPAVVIWAGAVYSYEDFIKYRLNDNSYRPPQMSSDRQRRRQQLFDAYGEFSKESEFWKQVAPTNYISDLQGAIQIHHAVNDNVVNIGYSRGLMKLLDGSKIIHELYEYPGGGHNIEGVYFTQAMQKTVEFFKNNL